MKVVKISMLTAALIPSSVFAFGLGDALNTLNAVNNTVNQIQNPQKSLPQPVTNTQAIPVATPSPVQSVTTAELPKEFHGNWGIDQSNDCKDAADGKVTVIEKDSITGYEWHSEIKSTQWVQTGTTLDVSASNCEEGECSPPTKQTWTLSNSGNSLSIADAAGGVKKFSRCRVASSNALTSKSVIATNASKEVIYSCKTAKGNKVITLSKADNLIQYSVGFPDKKPDVFIEIPQDKVIYQYGSGRTIAVNFDKENLNYTVGYFANGKQIEGHDIYVNGANVANSTNYKTVSQIVCDNKESYETRLQSYIEKNQ